MVKRVGPKFAKSKRALKSCSDCKSTGLIKGVFHQMVCFACNGGGVVLKDTGEALTSDELVVELRLRLSERGDRIRQLEKQIVELEPYIDMKQAADLQEAMYPKKLTQQRASTGKGGYGD